MSGWGEWRRAREEREEGWKDSRRIKNIGKALNPKHGKASKKAFHEVRGGGPAVVGIRFNIRFMAVVKSDELRGEVRGGEQVWSEGVRMKGGVSVESRKVGGVESKKPGLRESEKRG